MNQFIVVQYFIKYENELFIRIVNDFKGMEEIILEYGYIGMIIIDYFEVIIGIVILSIVSKRLLYFKEFKRGLDYFGFFSVMQNNVDLCKIFFFINQDEVDVNYVVFFLWFQFFEKGIFK